MITVLIPLDYSEATRNVLDYIAASSHERPINRIILLKSNYYSVYQQVVHSAEYVYLHQQNFEREREEALEHLHMLSKAFLEKISPDIRVEHAMTEIPLDQAISEIITQEKPDLLVLSSARNADDSHFIARNAISIAKASTIPVMIIPENTTYQPVTTALVPVDFNALHRLEAFRAPLFAAAGVKPFLQVLNINKGSNESEMQQSEHILSHLLDGYSFSIHRAADNDILHGITQYMEQHPVQLIVALPGKYNFFKSLTHRSITQAIALDARVPVLLLNQRRE